MCLLGRKELCTDEVAPNGLSEEEQRGQAGGDGLAIEQVLRFLSSRGWWAPRQAWDQSGWPYSSLSPFLAFLSCSRNPFIHVFVFLSLSLQMLSNSLNTSDGFVYPCIRAVLWIPLPQRKTGTSGACCTLA